MKTKSIYIHSLIALATLLLFSCKVTYKKPLSISFVGGLSFRKSFAFIQSMYLTEKQIADYVDEVEKSNPGIFHSQDSTLIVQFEKTGIVKNGELLLDKFIYSDKENFTFKDSGGKEINVHFCRPQDCNENWIKTYSCKDSSSIMIDAQFMDLKYCMVDIVPGGNKEIVLLSEYYISKGNNYGLEVYQINN